MSDRTPNHREVLHVIDQTSGVPFSVEGDSSTGAINLGTFLGVAPSGTRVTRNHSATLHAIDEITGDPFAVSGDSTDGSINIIEV